MPGIKETEYRLIRCLMNRPEGFAKIDRNTEERVKKKNILEILMPDLTTQNGWHYPSTIIKMKDADNKLIFKSGRSNLSKTAIKLQEIGILQIEKYLTIDRHKRTTKQFYCYRLKDTIPAFKKIFLGIVNNMKSHSDLRAFFESNYMQQNQSFNQLSSEFNEALFKYGKEEHKLEKRTTRDIIVHIPSLFGAFIFQSPDFDRFTKRYFEMINSSGQHSAGTAQAFLLTYGYFATFLNGSFNKSRTSSEPADLEESRKYFLERSKISYQLLVNSLHIEQVNKEQLGIMRQIVQNIATKQEFESQAFRDKKKSIKGGKIS